MPMTKYEGIINTKNIVLCSPYVMYVGVIIIEIITVTNVEIIGDNHKTFRLIKNIITTIYFL